MKKKAYFQNGHRQSNNFGEIHTKKEITPQGDGSLKASETNTEQVPSKKEVQHTVDDILDKNDEDKV